MFRSIGVVSIIFQKHINDEYVRINCCRGILGIFHKVICTNTFRLIIEFRIIM